MANLKKIDVNNGQVGVVHTGDPVVDPQKKWEAGTAEIVTSASQGGLLYALNQMAAGTGTFSYSAANGYVFTPAS